ncbi:MAG: DUF3391 domain-containing protein, partial [Caldimonas sp.]
MKAATLTPEIDIQALRVGMFVHLDVGWMSHPFPLSSFRITTPAQVATIRSLGLRRVRWSPQQSDLSLTDGGDASAALARPSPLAANDDVEGAPAEAAVGDDTAPATLAGPAGAPADGMRAALRRRLEAQHEALAVCERQYGEASRACRQTIELVAA